MPGRFLIALSFVLSGSCFAQANVGDVIKLGAVKMTKEELQQLHAGGSRFNVCSIIWKADGRYFASPDDAPATEVRERQFVK